MSVASLARILDTRLLLGTLGVLVCAVSSTAPTPVQGARLIQGMSSYRVCDPANCGDGLPGSAGYWGGPADAWETFTITPPTDADSAAPYEAWTAATTAPAGELSPGGAGLQVPSGAVSGPLLDLTGPPEGGPQYEVITVGPPLPPPPVVPEPVVAQPAAPAAPDAPQPVQPHPPTTPQPTAQLFGSEPPAGPPTPGPPQDPLAPQHEPTLRPTGSTAAAPTAVAPAASTPPSSVPSATSPVPAWTEPGTAAHAQGWGSPTAFDDLGKDGDQWTIARSGPISDESPPATNPSAGVLTLTVPRPVGSGELRSATEGTWVPRAPDGRWESRMRLHLPTGCAAALTLINTDAQATAPLAGPVLQSSAAASRLAASDPTLGDWHNWAVELTDTTQRLYIDGQLVEEEPRTAVATSMRLQVQLTCSTTADRSEDQRPDAMAHAEVDWAAYYQAVVG